MAGKYKFDGWFADFNFKPKRKTNRGWFNINYKYSREMMLNLNPDPSKIPDFNSSDSMYNTDYDFEKANKRFEISLSNEMNKNPMDGSGKCSVILSGIILLRALKIICSRSSGSLFMSSKNFQINGASQTEFFVETRNASWFEIMKNPGSNCQC